MLMKKSMKAAFIAMPMLKTRLRNSVTSSSG